MPVQKKITPAAKKTAKKRRKQATANGATPRSAKKQSVHQQHIAELYTFTNSFFALLGGKVKRTTRRKYSPLLVTLSAELADYFETETLHLAFQQAEPGQGQLLVAHGSPIFDKMIGYLERKSAVALQQLPVRHNAGEELLQAVRPTNAGIVNLRTQQEIQPLFAFHWRITYRADDKREELYTVILDADGQRIPHPDEVAQGEEKGQAGANGTSPLAVDTLLADAEEPPLEADTEGQLLPPKLPPMTHLVRLAEMARKYAIYHADVRSVSHEAEILPRLYKTLNRLSTYYQQQIEEVYDAHDLTGEKRLGLEEDLTRKLAEEVENHRLRVQLQLVSYVVFRVPVTKALMTLNDGKRDVAITVERNRYTGLLRRPTCHACGNEVSQLAIDRNGHISCDACIQQCGSCQELLCAECGVAPCPTCGTANCDSCGHLCWACGERACADHISSCPTCGDAVCHACQTACDLCGVQQCRTHLRLDHVRAEQGETFLVCAACVLRCPGCEQYSAQIGRCERSGQRFCTRCLVACVSCGTQVGPGFYELFDEQPYCLNCLQECPSCGRWVQSATPCPTCGVGYCAACGPACACCGQGHCAAHSHHIATCDHTICQQHLVHCTLCATDLCPICADSCAICGGYHCAAHGARCHRCRQHYCGGCIGEEGLCATCAGLDQERDAVDLHQEPCATDSRVQALVDNFAWACATNQRYKIYWGEGSLGRTATIVTTADELDETIILIHSKGSTKNKAAADAVALAPPSPDEKDPAEWMGEFQEWLRRMRRRRRR